MWCLRDKTISVNRSYAALDFCFRASRSMDASRLPTKAFLEQWRNPAAYSRFPGSQTQRRIILRIPLELYLRVICVLKHDALKTSSTLWDARQFFVEKQTRVTAASSVEQLSSLLGKGHVVWPNYYHRSCSPIHRSFITHFFCHLSLGATAPPVLAQPTFRLFDCGHRRL